MDKNSLGNKIKNSRKKHNMTQQQLADLIGVSNKAISKWENDEGIPDIDNLKRVSQVFNLSIDYLVGNDAPRYRLLFEDKIILMCIFLGLFLILFPTILSFLQGTNDYTLVKHIYNGLLYRQTYSIIFILVFLLVLSNDIMHAIRIVKNRKKSYGLICSILGLVAAFILLLMSLTLGSDLKNNFDINLHFLSGLYCLLQVIKFSMHLKMTTRKNSEITEH